MKPNLKTGVLVNCTSVTVRERISRFFLGTPHRMMTCVNYDSIEEQVIV